MLVKILNKFNCQSFPIDNTAIDVPEEVLDLIGVKYCFDVVNNKVIPYDNTISLAIEEKKLAIEEYKNMLNNTDYQAIKYAEGLISESDYLPIKTLRQTYRDEINRLEADLLRLGV